jgi:hypothetical protein
MRSPLRWSLVGLAFLFGVFPLWDYDLWGHLAAAQRIVETGSIEATDPFLWGVEGRPWCNLYWGFQLLLLLIYTLGGAAGLVLLKAGLAAAAVGLSLASLPDSLPDWAVALTWLVPLVSLSGRIYERPETLSLVLLAAFCCVLAHAGRRPNLVWLLPPLQLVWVNVHPFFIFGPLVTALWWLDRAPAPPRRVMAWVTAAVLLACLCNPYGVRGALFPLQVILGQGADHLYFKQYIAELRPISFFLARDPSNPYLLALLGTTGIATLGLIAMAWSRRIVPSRVILVLLFGALGWSATRNVAFFALIAATSAGSSFDAALAAWRARTLAATPRAKRRREAAAREAAQRAGDASDGTRSQPAHGAASFSRWAAWGAIALVALGLVSGAFYDWAGEGRVFGWGEREAWYAHAAQRALVAPGMPRRAFVSQLGEANLTLFHGNGYVRVFIDPRLEVASRELFERYLTILRGMAAGDPTVWEPLLKRDDGWPSILLDRARSSAQIEGVARAPGWRVTYQDELAVVFVRDP